jgi:hypothetical protein
MVMWVQFWTMRYPTREVPLRRGMPVLSVLEIDLSRRNFVLMPGGDAPFHFDIVRVPGPLRIDPRCEEWTAVGLPALLGH